jgi:hypothetical protein
MTEPFGPVQPVTGADLPLCKVQVDLNAVAVELDFIEPLVANGTPWLSGLPVGI